MAFQNYDFRGLKCPQPTLKLSTLTFKIQKGDLVEITGDCETFEDDIKSWCQRNKKVLLWVKEGEAKAKVCQIQY